MCAQCIEMCSGTGRNSSLMNDQFTALCQRRKSSTDNSLLCHCSGMIDWRPIVVSLQVKVIFLSPFWISELMSCWRCLPTTSHWQGTRVSTRSPATAQLRLSHRVSQARVCTGLSITERRLGGVWASSSTRGSLTRVSDYPSTARTMTTHGTWVTRSLICTWRSRRGRNRRGTSPWASYASQRPRWTGSGWRRTPVMDSCECFSRTRRCLKCSPVLYQPPPTNSAYSAGDPPTPCTFSWMGTLFGGWSRLTARWPFRMNTYRTWATRTPRRFSRWGCVPTSPGLSSSMQVRRWFSLLGSLTGAHNIIWDHPGCF